MSLHLHLHSKQTDNKQAFLFIYEWLTIDSDVFSVFPQIRTVFNLEMSSQWGKEHEEN